jgi:hypothetical protein
VAEGQAERIVVNLRDWNGEPAALRRQFDDWPVHGLKELVIITRDGQIQDWPIRPGGS